jgi:trimethylamine--corrinoid protein Co-methyltransferase
MSNMVLRVLSDEEIERLHEKTLEVFEGVGAKITHAEALSKLKRAGARVDESSGIVRFPAAMVKELLALAPEEALQTGINGKLLHTGGGNRTYSSLVIDPFIADGDRGVRRPVLDDVRRHTILGESLLRIDGLHRMQFPVSDAPEPDSYIKTLEIFLCHTTKHVMASPASVENGQEWMDVSEAIADAAGLDVASTPLLTLAMAVTSPLQIHGPNVEIMKMAMSRCYPIMPTVCPMAGTTSPYSVAGTVLQANVETLLPVLLAQLYKPGHPVFYAIGPSVTDMRSGHDLYYGAEKLLFKTAAMQMGKFYGLPIATESAGSLTWRPDMQNGAESMLILLTGMVGGQNFVGGLGSLHNANGMSAEQIVMHCGLAEMAEFLARGVDLSDQKLALESIAAAGPGGNYLTDRLTVELLRSGEFFHSRVLDMTGGYTDGTPGMYDIAHAKVEQLIAEYRPTVPEKVQEAIRTYCRSKYRSPEVAKLGWG